MTMTMTMSKNDKILDILKIKDESGNFKNITVSVPAILEKSNHIHAWFVENIQDGVDDCCNIMSLSKI